MHKLKFYNYVMAQVNCRQVFHIRKGVMWTGNERIGIAPREFTAYDAEFAIKRWLNHPEAFVKSSWYDTANIKATDKYTLVVPLLWYNSSAFEWHRFFFGIQPEEVVKAGATDWRNQTGTGPFILTNYVEDGYLAVYDRSNQRSNRYQPDVVLHNPVSPSTA